MDYRNASIPVDKVTSFDVNKAIQRSLTKAVARHGLGLYIYAGEDLPEDEKNVVKNDVLDAALAEVKRANDVEALKAVYFKYEEKLKNNSQFINEVNSRKDKLQKAA